MFGFIVMIVLQLISIVAAQHQPIGSIRPITKAGLCENEMFTIGDGTFKRTWKILMPDSRFRQRISGGRGPM
jgi:hypothetical protein